VDYFVAQRIYDTSRKADKNRYLAKSLLFNLGLLFVFKYYNFFVSNLPSWFSSGAETSLMHSFILPVGISFYTFQTISYSIDVYRSDIKPARNFLDFALFVSFFPQLVAGPIERAGNVLPQLQKYIFLDSRQISFGLKLILLGFIKKILFANNFAEYVDIVYAAPSSFTGWEVVFATFLFAGQIYFDFSAYTDIARGSAKLFGIDLMENFRGPYFSSSIKEFWRRWHISLSTWFRDYLYIPLGGNRVGAKRVYFNLVVVFLVTGLWHGANWTFVIWGMIHGVFLILERLGLGAILNKLPKILTVGYVMGVTLLSWVFFRAASVGEALEIYTAMLNLDPSTIFELSVYKGDQQMVDYLVLLVLVILGIIMHFIEYKTPLVPGLNKLSSNKRFIVILLSCIVLVLFGKYFDNSQFIYFQF